MKWTRCGGLVCLVFISLVSPASAGDKVLKADARLRPPEMLVDEASGQVSGPLVEIFHEAARAVGMNVEWRAVPFPRSLAQLQTGTTDIVPRLIQTPEREEFALFLGPIGKQPADIEFLVRNGKEGSLASYDDLKKLTVCVKPKTVYFDRFDKDASIRKTEGLKDDDLARLFAGGFCDTVVVVDKPALDKALKDRQIADYTWARYKVPTQWGIFYGMSKASQHAGQAAALSRELVKLARSGRVAAIYKKHNAPPPLR